MYRQVLLLFSLITLSKPTNDLGLSDNNLCTEYRSDITDVCTECKASYVFLVAQHR